MKKEIKILLIEDSDKDQFIFEQFVKENALPYDYIIAESISEAKNALQTNVFDFVVCKYILCDGTALDIITNISDDILKVIITGSGDEEIPVNAMKAVSADYIIKDPNNRYLDVIHYYIENSINKINNKQTFYKYKAHIKKLEDNNVIQADDKVKSSKELYKHHSIIQAINTAAQSLLSKNFLDDTTIQEAFTQIGKALEVSRVYIYKNYFEEESLFTSQLYEWTAPDVTSQIANNQNISFKTSGLKRWKRILGQNKIYQGHVRDFLLKEQKLLLPQNIYSIILMPIFVEKEWWGFMGFDDCCQERQWSKVEISTLKTLSSILSILIQNESTEKYRLMIESNKDLIFICSSDYRIKYMNSALINKIGNNLIGEECKKVLSGLNENCPWCCKENANWEESFEKEISHPVGDSVFFVSGTNIVQNDGTIVKMNIYKDITNIKLMQNMLVRSERLAATGELALSVAHEINSPLQAATIMLDSLRKKYFDDNVLLNNIILLKNSFYSIRDTVKNLLDLNRPGIDHKELIDLNKIIENAIDLNSSILNDSNITCNFEPSQKPLKIMASPQQLNKVVMNLLKNSIEAMEGILNKKILNIKTEYENGSVILKISDTGAGISEQDLDHIFDPFYTQKKKMGLGVGLSVCHGIIEDHDGTITAKNLPEKGAVFTVNLPTNEVNQNEE
ncbi:PAS/PAC sensor signal transduction histidine kinase [Candidatus Magnetomorum sp. HK-1]|nr:PAS/PAC sensor signal transduction histidine kinase [Candidatus Magnetomorum sp. HK-1]